MRAGLPPTASGAAATGRLLPRCTVAARSVRTAAAALVTALATAVGSSAVAQQRLDTLVIMRIEDDRSNVCIHALQIDLDALPSQRLGSGCATRRADAPPFDARFEIGSISKALVGVLAAEMAARGELRLDEPISALLPAGTAAPQINETPITLADLLTHTSGLPRLPAGFRPGNPANPYADLTATGVYGGLAGLRPDHPPGKQYAYSNWAFLMLSDMLARRAGQPFDVLLRTRVLAPLRMNDTRVSGSEGLVQGRHANGQPASNWDVPAAFAGVGGIRSTVEDLGRLARAMLGDAPEDIAPSLRNALRISRDKLRDGNAQVDVAWAWHLRKRTDMAPLVFHNGMTAGFSSMLVLDIAQRRAAVVLADAAGGFDDLALRLVDGSVPMLPPRRAVPLDLRRAQGLVGRYQLRPGFIITITLDEGRLHAQATGQSRFELLQDSRGDYYALVADIVMRFRRAADGRAEALTLFQGGGALPAARIE
jgi:D-alanyl-D-alanine-carboxypeptidase/D-alanyl-D-alanine-endopeptidase